MKVIHVLKLKIKILLPVILLLVFAGMTFGKVGQKRIITVVAEKVKETLLPRKEVNTKLQQKPQRVSVKKDKGYAVAQSNGSLPSSGTQEKILFVREDNGNQEIYLADLDGNNQKNLTNNPANDYDPSPSLDGKKIVFVSDRDGQPEIYVMNNDGTSVARLTNNIDGEEMPSFSPDGTKILFERYPYKINDLGKPYRDIEIEDAFDVWIMNADGANPVNLTNNNASAVPSFSPDGKKIVYVSYENSLGQIALMNVDGSGRVLLTHKDNDELSCPVFSPTGDKIFFRDNPDNLCSIMVDGSSEQCFDNADFCPIFVPDTNKIVDVITNKIFIMNPDGTEKEQIAPNISDATSAIIIRIKPS